MHSVEPVPSKQICRWSLNVKFCYPLTACETYQASSDTFTIRYINAIWQNPNGFLRYVKSTHLKLLSHFTHKGSCTC